MIAKLFRSTQPAKKWMVVIGTRRVHFGARGYDDYTIHKDKERQRRYVNRHRSRENWGPTGIFTPGFWSRWILWNKPSLRESIRDTKQRFGFSKILLA